MRPMQPQLHGHDADRPLTPPEEVYIRFPLSGGNAVEIRLERRVSRSDFETIKSLVELSKKSLIK